MLHLPLRTIDYILSEFEKKLAGYSVQTFPINPFEKVLLVEDSLPLYVGTIESNLPAYIGVEKHARVKGNPFIDMYVKASTYYVLHIEELTYNSLGFRYNHSGFIRDMEKITGMDYLGLCISYRKFKGYTRLYWCPDSETLVEQIEKLLPELKLRERYEAWDGIHYYFVVFELTGAKGNIGYGVGYTNQKPHSYVVLKAHDWIINGFNARDIRTDERGFFGVLRSWKGTNRQYQLENHMQYFYVEKNLREKDLAWRYADEVLQSAYENKFAELERNTYTKPVNKWTSEETVFNITKKLYKAYKVIYQHRPFFLKSPVGGQMSYDVFISGLNIAIEYQGKQHFEPVEFFGGEVAFENTVKRDKLKRELSAQHGIKLIYVNYWEVITPQLIKSKIESLQG